MNLPSINTLTAPLVQDLVDNASSLRLGVETLENGTTLIDAGMNHPGGLEVGRRIAEICLGGLGSVRIRAGTEFANWRWHLDVHTSNPVIACLASQYAGWSLEHGEGDDVFRALGSGPARAMGSREELFDELAYRDKAESAALVLEISDPPPQAIADKIADYCGISPQALSLIMTPTTSLPGAVQVVARSLEVALHKVHALKFPLDQICDGLATAPICPPSQNFITAMGRTNDAILFGGQVQLYVDSDDVDAEELAKNLPSSASKDYGKPFAQVFKDSGYNFYEIDEMLFSPARVAITSLKTGNTFYGGKVDEKLLDLSFGS